MEGRLRAGTVLSSDSGARYTVKKYCAAGAQGEVYQVETGGKIYALKWYYPDGATAQQKNAAERCLFRAEPVFLAVPRGRMDSHRIVRADLNDRPVAGDDAELPGI